MADTGTKTLAQLEEEGKEKKYVTLETGAKISGYTKEYLERLCRLNQVNYRVWNNGQLVIELESLLDATKAILLSYDGISFVDRQELMDPMPQIVGKVLADTFAEVAGSRPSIAPEDVKPLAQPIPTFLNANRIPSTTDHPQEHFSVIGRPVDANRELFDDEREVHIPVTDVGTKTAAVSIASSSAAKPIAELPDVNKQTTSPLPSSSYRPVVTSVDPTPHHDPAPLFPPLNKGEKRGPIVVLPKNGDEENTSTSSARRGAVHLTITKEEREPLVRPASVGAPSQEIHPLDDWDRLLFHDAKPVAEHTLSAGENSSAIPLAETANVHTDTVRDQTAQTEKHSAISTSPERKIPVSSSARHPSLPKKYSAIPVAMPIPHAPTRVVRGTEYAPALRVMPGHDILIPGHSMPAQYKPNSSVLASSRNLPASSSGQHLIPIEPHPLMKSTGFNVAFLVIVSTMLTLALGGVIVDRARTFLSGAPEEYVATAGLPGLTFSGGVLEEFVEPESMVATGTLQFSDPIVVVEDDDGRTLLVQPLFPSGAGAVEEFPLYQ